MIMNAHERDVLPRALINLPLATRNSIWELVCLLTRRPSLKAISSDTMSSYDLELWRVLYSVPPFLSGRSILFARGAPKSDSSLKWLILALLGWRVIAPICCVIIWVILTAVSSRNALGAHQFFEYLNKSQCILEWSCFMIFRTHSASLFSASLIAQSYLAR